MNKNLLTPIAALLTPSASLPLLAAEVRLLSQACEQAVALSAAPIW